MYLTSQNVLRDSVKWVDTRRRFSGRLFFPGASIYEECTVETLNKLKPLDPFVEVSLQSLSLEGSVEEEDGVYQKTTGITVISSIH